MSTFQRVVIPDGCRISPSACQSCRPDVIAPVAERKTRLGCDVLPQNYVFSVDCRVLDRSAPKYPARESVLRQFSTDAAPPSLSSPGEPIVKRRMTAQGPPCGLADDVRSIRRARGSTSTGQYLRGEASGSSRMTGARPCRSIWRTAVSSCAARTRCSFRPSSYAMNHAGDGCRPGSEGRQPAFAGRSSAIRSGIASQAPSRHARTARAGFSLSKCRERIRAEAAL